MPATGGLLVVQLVLVGEQVVTEVARAGGGGAVFACRGQEGR
jgi:hypothetical protein